MWLIVGLGNPGQRYKGTRHNMGFLALDRISERMGITVRRRSLKVSTGRGTYGSESIILMKPLGFMNRSGEVVAPFARRKGVDSSRVLVMTDDLDLPFGTVRYRLKGSSAGHRGMQSIANHLGHSDFPRIRLGIGRPEKGQDTSKFVLSRFPGREAKVLDSTLDAVADLVLDIVSGGITDPITLNLCSTEEEL